VLRAISTQVVAMAESARIPDRRNSVSTIATVMPMAIDSKAISMVTSAPSSICGSEFSAWFQRKL